MESDYRHGHSNAALVQDTGAVPKGCLIKFLWGVRYARRATKLNGWNLIWMIIAGVYAIPVALVVWLNFPTERQIKLQTASEAVRALQQHEDKYKNITVRDLRRRLYRGLSDDQVTARVREFAATEDQRVRARVREFAVSEEHGVIALYKELAATEEQRVTNSAAPTEVAYRPMVSVLMDEVDKKYAQRMVSLESEQLKMIGWGVMGWALPMFALYGLGWRIARPQKRVKRQ